MFTFALSAAWRRKRRLLSTVAAVVLGIAFLSATLVVGASATAGFRDTFVTANAGIDAYVRSSQSLTGGATTVRPPIPASVASDVASVDGVARAEPLVEGSAQVLDADGRPVAGDGPDTLAQNWVPDPELTGWRLTDGRAPRSDGEVVLDRATAGDAGIGVGDEVDVLAPARVPATVVGIAAFGDEDSIAGSTFVAFSTPEAQRLLLGSTDVVSAVLVAGEGSGPGGDAAAAEVADRVAQVLPEGVQVLTGDELTQEQQDEVDSDLVGALTTALLVFAVVALVVAAFGIANTFSILAAQRVRESALLRALGASQRQVLGAALVEAALVGLAGSVAGVVAGLAVASALLAAAGSVGFDLPVDGLVLPFGDVVLCVGVGVLVTMASAMPAAWRAARVPPVAALREVASGDGHVGARRVRAGVVAVVLGALAVVASGGGALGLAGIGGLLLIAGMVLVGPAVVRPVCGVLGAPVAARSQDGDLARRNAVRNPRRSAATASALLVGVGVVSLFAVFGASAARSVDEAVTRSFAGDVAVVPSSPAAGIAPDVIDTVAELPEVQAVAGVGRGAAVIDGQQDDIAFADLDSLPAAVDLDVGAGSLAAVDDGALAVSADYAEERGWASGDAVDVRFPDGTTDTLRLAAVYDSEAIVGDAVVTRALWAAHAGQPRFDVAVVRLADGVSLDEGRAAVTAATVDDGAPDVLDREGFLDAEVGEVSSLLNLAYALLAVAIVIALVGIASTMSLSVHERTRELGLLRAVGQTRAQARAMVRWEAVLVAAFGAVGGVGMGTFLGWGVVRAIHARADIATFDLPVGALLAALAAGVAVGVLAGLRPARRAAALPVLDAIRTG